MYAGTLEFHIGSARRSTPHLTPTIFHGSSPPVKSESAAVLHAMFAKSLTTALAGVTHLRSRV